MPSGFPGLARLPVLDVERDGLTGILLHPGSMGVPGYLTSSISLGRQVLSKNDSSGL
jgi:hypothetical protein